MEFFNSVSKWSFSVHKKTKSRCFQIPRFEKRFSKAPFSWHINVDGKPNRSSVFKFLWRLWMRPDLFEKPAGKCQSRTGSFHLNQSPVPCWLFSQSAAHVPAILLLITCFWITPWLADWIITSLVAVLCSHGLVACFFRCLSWIQIYCHNYFMYNLKMMSSPHCAVSVLNVCEPHKHWMQIDLIRYEPLTLSLRRILNLFLTVSLSFTAMKVFHQVISERMKHKASHR